MLYLMLVLVFSKLSSKWWLFLIVGYGEDCLIYYTTQSLGSQSPISSLLQFSYSKDSTKLLKIDRLN